jgi:hypothetical protein
MYMWKHLEMSMKLFDYEQICYKTIVKWIVVLAIIILLTFSRELNKIMHEQTNSTVVKPMEYFILLCFTYWVNVILHVQNSLM